MSVNIRISEGETPAEWMVPDRSIQHRSERILLVVNPPKQNVHLNTQSHDINSTPIEVYHGHELRFEVVGDVDATEFVDWLETKRDLLDRIVGGYSSYWDGSNNVARYTEDSLKAQNKLQALLYPYNDWHNPANIDSDLPTHDLVLWEAEEWLYMTKTDIIDNYAITPYISYDELEKIANELNDEAKGDDVKLYNTLETLEKWREELKEELQYS